MLQPKCENAKFTLSAHHFLDHFKELANLSVNNQDDVIDSEAHTFDNNYVPDNVVDELKGHAQTKIIKKSVISFWLLNMTI